MSRSDPDAVFAALRGADPDVMDRDQLAIVVRQCAQLASWVDAVKVRATRRQRVLADEGRAEAPKDLLAREGGESGREGHSDLRRAPQRPVGTTGHARALSTFYRCPAVCASSYRMSIRRTRPVKPR